METMRLGRNDVCCCGSGRKYKKCCLPRQSGAVPVLRAPPPGGTPTIPLSDPGLEAFEHKDVVFVKGKGWTHESELKPGDQYRLKGGGWETVMPERVIGTTHEHPFYSQERGWTPAGELQPGEMIRTEDGWVPVKSVEDTGRYETVYNLRVADYHTYFVGAQDWGFAVWAHNNDGCVHRVGGGEESNLGLKPHEAKLDPPGISVLIGGTPADTAAAFRRVFGPKSSLGKAARTVGTAEIEQIRAAGFDVVPVTTTNFPNHGRIVHPTEGAAGFTPANLQRLSQVFTNTTGL